MQILKPGRPPDWEEPKMTGYFESMWANTVATFAQKDESHWLCRIDDLMFDVANGWSGASPTAQTIRSTAYVLSRALCVPSGVRDEDGRRDCGGRILNIC